MSDMQFKEPESVADALERILGCLSRADRALIEGEIQRGRAALKRIVERTQHATIQRAAQDACGIARQALSGYPKVESPSFSPNFDERNGIT
jgi:hypothetical protein